jgi:hypothetical protein
VWCISISHGAKFARFQGKLTIPCAVCTKISQYQQESKNLKIVHTICQKKELFIQEEA